MAGLLPRANSARNVQHRTESIRTRCPTSRMFQKASAALPAAEWEEDMPRTTWRPGAALAGVVTVLAMSAAAQQRPDWQYPAVHGAGPVVPVPTATAKLPDGQTYKVVFNVAQGTPGDGRVSSDLASVARFVNLIALSGMDPKQADIVAVVHGPATAAVISDPYYPVLSSAVRHRQSQHRPGAATGGEWRGGDRLRAGCCRRGCPI